jgi:crotonobetainyl-CoA:carnitine CoA-transferase CaiB-like acyl-CoA transferase
VTELPLDGIRVLDLSRLLPGAFCTQMLADFGADVVKVEDPRAGDYARWIEPRFDGAEPSGGSAFFASLNRNKRSVRLDLKHPDGRDCLLELVDGADVVLESFRPGVLDRLGLGHEQLLARNPRLIVCAISGYGQDGPYRERSGHDINYLAATGVLDLCGEDDHPSLPGVQVADIGGGALMAAFGILAALRHRDQSGHGQVVDVSMAHGALAWLGPLAAELAAGRPPRRGELALGGGALCYRVYRCRDGWVALGALEPKFFAAFCQAVAREDLIPYRLDPPGSPAHRALEAIFAARGRDEWAVVAAEHDCCLEIVRTLEEALATDLVSRRGMLAEVALPGRAATATVLGTPLQLSRTPADHNHFPVPALGEHTDEILAAAGLSAARIAALHQSGAAAGRSVDAGEVFLD